MRNKHYIYKTRPRACVRVSLALMSQSQSGILHNGGIPNGPLIHLPLEELRVKVLIIDGTYTFWISSIAVRSNMWKMIQFQLV